MTEPTPLTDDLGPMFRRIESHLQLLPSLTPEEVAERDRTIAEWRWQSYAQLDNIPRRLWAASLQSGMRTAAIIRATEYVTGSEYKKGGCLILAGPTGAGKSYAAVGAMRHLETGHFRYWPAMCGALLTPGTRPDELHALKASSLLVLDDVGAEYLKADGLVEAFFDEMIWHREGNMLPTIMTTNLTTEALKSRWSARIVDRIRGGWGSVAECVGESMRGTR